MRTLIAVAAIILFGHFVKLQAQLEHSLPPQMNLVGAGLNGEHGTKLQRASVYTFLAGAAITGMMVYAQDGEQSPGPLVLGGMFLGVGIHLNLRGLKWEQRAYRLQQMGYSPNQYYDTLPDSVSAGDRARLGLKDYMNGTPIHVPARFR